MKRRVKKSKEQKNIIYNIESLQKARKEAIKFHDNYFLMLSEAKNKASGKGLKILKPKQILQRLLVALAKVKSGNISQNLLNEIRKIVYSFY